MKNLGNLVKQAQKVKEEMDRLQEEMGSKTVEASSGGGMVTAVVNGRQEIVSVKIDPEVAESGDLEMLQDLVVAAVNEALPKIAGAVQPGSEQDGWRIRHTARDLLSGTDRRDLLMAADLSPLLRSPDRGTGEAPRDRPQVCPAIGLLSIEDIQEGGLLSG